MDVPANGKMPTALGRITVRAFWKRTFLRSLVAKEVI